MDPETQAALDAEHALDLEIDCYGAGRVIAHQLVRIATALETLAMDATARRAMEQLRTNKLLAEYECLRERMRVTIEPYDQLSDGDEALTRSDHYWSGVDRRAEQATQAAAAFEAEHPEIVALWEAQSPAEAEAAS